MTIHISSINDAPIVSSGNKTLQEDAALGFVQDDFLAWYSDAEGDALDRIKIISLPEHGVLTVTDSVYGDIAPGYEIALSDLSTLKYVPDEHWHGTDQFTWKGNDGQVYSNLTATITLVVTAVNDLPTVSAFTKYGQEDVPVSFSASDFTSHTVDVDGDALDKIQIVSLPTHGKLQLGGVDVSVQDVIVADSLAELNFLADAQWHGVTSWTWQAHDGSDYSASVSTVTLDVASVNDHPAAQRSVAQQYLNEGESISVTIQEIFTDADGDSLTISATSSQTNVATVKSVTDTAIEISALRAGYTEIEVNAADGHGGVGVLTFRVQVLGDEEEPATPVKTVTEEELTIIVETGEVGQGSEVTATTIKRQRDEAGYVKDLVTLSLDRAQETVQKLKAQGLRTARLVIPDTADEVAEVNVSVPHDALKSIAEGHTDLEIHTDNVRIHVPNASMNEFDEDLYFRIVPIKKQDERLIVEERTKKEELVRNVVKDKEVRILGRPMVIETNMESHPVTLTLPLTEPLPDHAAERQDLLDNLAVFIEHDDGTKELVSGRFVSYKEGNSQGIEFDINKFSTFSIVYMEGWAARAAAQGDKHLAYINGYPDGTFQPERLLTRAEFAAILSRFMPAQESSTDYTDVSSLHWAYAAIQTVSAAGLIKRDPSGSFRPDDAITRAEMATVMVLWKSTELTNDAASTVWQDVAGHWAERSIRAMELSGWMKGYPGGAFRPDGAVTRAEASVVINRVLDREPLEAAHADAVWTDVHAGHWAWGHILEASIDHEAAGTH